MGVNGLLRFLSGQARFSTEHSHLNRTGKGPGSMPFVGTESRVATVGDVGEVCRNWLTFDGHELPTLSVRLAVFPLKLVLQRNN